MSYSQKVLDHYENPRNVGSFDKTDADIGTGIVGAPAPSSSTLTNNRFVKNRICPLAHGIAKVPV